MKTLDNKRKALLEALKRKKAAQELRDRKRKPAKKGWIPAE